jgi:hypothetical protein
MQLYIEAQQAVLARLQSPPVTFLLEQWKFIVEECESGYRWDISEYHNEIRARDYLEDVLAAPELSSYLEHGELRTEVSMLDSRFRKIISPVWTVPGEERWWRRAVLRYGGPEYVNYMRDAYGMNVELVDV